MKMVNETAEKVYGRYPEKILQFGEGKFLRAFADWMVNKANASGKYQGSIVICQPISEGFSEVINAQEGVYTVIMCDCQNGEPVENAEKITSVSRCINPYQDYDALLAIARSKELEVIISNTTENGIAWYEGDKLTDRPPASYPAKLTACLYERYMAFQGAADKGLLILPVELIDANGEKLKRLVLRYAHEWGLADQFITWVDKNNFFATTLVDRIVTGYPSDRVSYFEEKLGYSDNLMVACETYNLWVIQGDKEWSDILPVHKTDAHVIWTDDLTPYRDRKVRILNGAHNAVGLASYLSGHNIVLDFMNDELFRRYLERVIQDEVVCTLELPEEELVEYAREVFARFDNPFIKHDLMAIAAYGCSKFNVRCLQSLLDYHKKTGEVPQLLAFSFAAFLAFYKGEMKEGRYTGRRPDGTEYVIRDDPGIIQFFCDLWKRGDPREVVRQVLSHREYWDGRDLTEVPRLESIVSSFLERILAAKNIREVMSDLIS